MAAQSHPSPSKRYWDHDVFLSFRGEDTRKNFTDHLYSALVHVGIRTFRDEEELPRGENISTKLLNAIRGSRISIVVFSKGYASSRWCLDELVEIVHCKNNIDQTLLPIFYDVNPSHVRNQIETFGKAFAKHEERFQADMERLQRWREALTEAADCSGWDLESLANGYESTFIKKIVDEVLCKVGVDRLNVAECPIGIDSRVKRVKDLLNLATSDIRIVGIYGMAGIGKTVIAKAIYNKICYEFEGHVCLLDIKETSKQLNGLVQLQNKLLYSILKKNLVIDNVDRGLTLIKERLHGKRVLVILDDVDDLKQVHALVGSFEYFGPGSRVIVTTRDELLLTQLEVHEKYKVEELDYWESRQLFCWHAFKLANPPKDYLKLSTSAVMYAGGLPLALEVLGSFLHKRSIVEWESELEILQKFPLENIQKILKLSFDSLDDLVKDIFLDIACYFIGMEEEYVIKILEGCGFFPHIGINTLVQRSLLTIDYNKKLRMHDLIRDMGREIVRAESTHNPGQRSRLWVQEDVLNVLGKHMGSTVVEGLILNLLRVEEVHLKTEAFAKMKNLRLLQINGVHLTGCYEDISRELKWLCWHMCPLKFLPLNFPVENLTVLDMQYSTVREVWKGNRILNNLKVLNVSHSKLLIRLPDFSKVPQLEMLMVEDCTSLTQVHGSIGHLERLHFLNLKGCTNLRNLPASTAHLSSLRRLNLSDCFELTKLPELGNQMDLRELYADRSGIKELPSSIGLLKNLTHLSLSGCNRPSAKSWMSCFLSCISRRSSKRTSLLPASVSGLCSVSTINLSDCNLFEDDIPTDFGGLSSLRELNLSRNNLRNLPRCIGSLPRLMILWLNECTALQSISKLPVNLEYLYAYGCTSLERISIFSDMKSSPLFVLHNCHKLVEIQGLERLKSPYVIHMEGCYNLSSDFRKSLLQCPSSKHVALCRAIFLPGSEAPNWFRYQRIGSSISFEVPLLSGGEICGLVFYAVYAAEEESNEIITVPRVIINNKTRPYSYTLLPTFCAILITREDHFFLYQIPHIRDLVMESRDKLEVSIALMRPFEVKKCGIHLVVGEPNLTDEYASVNHYVDSDTTSDGAGYGVRRASQNSGKKLKKNWRRCESESEM